MSVDEDCAAVAPAASAVLSDVAIGATVAPSLPTVLSTMACTDAASPSDSGATFPTLAIQNAGTTYTATIPLSNGAGGGTGGGVAGTDPSTLAGWIDFNHDGTFDPAEMATVMVLPGSTSVDLTWTLPTDLTVGPSAVRLRIGHNAVQTASPAGMSDSGEIEDSTVQVQDVVVSPPGPVSPAELAPTGANSFTLLLAAIALVFIGTAATSASRPAATTAGNPTMPRLVYTTASEWLAAVEHRLTDPDIVERLTDRHMPATAVLLVARVEANHADDVGHVELSASELAAQAALRTKLAKRGRLALINMGAEVFLEPAAPDGELVRALQMPVRGTGLHDRQYQ